MDQPLLLVLRGGDLELCPLLYMEGLEGIV